MTLTFRRTLMASGDKDPGDFKKTTPSEAMTSPRVEESETALSGISAPSPDENKSWANELISGAQLVPTRVLRNRCLRYVTLTNKDQALWSCVARRITKDLETSEVLADENVTHMTKEELHRTLDRPRKIRVEFYAHLNSDEADRSEEACAPNRTARQGRRTKELN